MRKQGPLINDTSAAFLWTGYQLHYLT